MKIKKVAQTPGVLATVSTSKIDSDKDTYSCNYLNDNSVVVSPTEPSDGKVWLQKGKNLWGGIKSDIVFNGLTTNIKDDKFTMTGIAEWPAWCFETRGRPFINLKAGTYVFSIKNFSGSFSNAISLNITHSGGTVVDVSVNSSSIKNYYKEFTLTQDTPLYLDFYINSNNINFNNVSFNIQVEEGTTPTEYEPYIPKKIHTKTDIGYEEFYNEEDHNKVNYSKFEQRIGTWINGKPLYRKIVYYTNALTSGNNAIAHHISNISVIAKVDGYAILGANNYRTGAFESSTKFINIKTVDSTYINVQVGSDWGSSFKNGFVTILEYTKTTD